MIQLYCVVIFVISLSTLKTRFQQFTFHRIRRQSKRTTDCSVFISFLIVPRHIRNFINLIP